MKSKNKSVYALISTALFVVLLSACATAPKEAPAPVATAEPDQSDPVLPVAALPVDVPVQKKELAPVEAQALPARGSVARVVKKLETSPYALYWREKNAYSYYIGGLLRAEYQPDSGLTVQELKGDDAGVVCQFGKNGLQAKAANDAKADETCSQLMFTLDDELGD
ncbi:MAG TPA: hypothetical protein ENK06_08775 [Gammaproteobacteria bacterium]|nr:hypothetical protein [Gammaproteobacteria bacterium]